MQESEKAQGKFTSAIIWSVFIAMYSYIVPALAGYVFDFLVLIVMLLIFPLVVVLVPSAAHFMLQRVFRKKQYLYDKILYIFTAILVLFQFIIGPVTFLFPPNTAFTVDYLLIVYQIVLLVIAVKVIANLKYWQAVSTTLASLVAGALIFICALPFIFSMIGGVNQTMR